MMHSIMVFGNFLNVLNYKSLKIAYHMVTVTYICIKNDHKNKLHPGWKFTYIFLNFVKPQPPPFKRPLPLSEFPPFLRKMSNPPLWAPFWKKPSPPFLKGGGVRTMQDQRPTALTWYQLLSFSQLVSASHFLSVIISFFQFQFFTFV